MSVNESVVYVSLAPGSVPTGTLAAVRNQTTGQSVTTAVVNGGFDPVAIAASVGDTLVVEVRGPSGDVIRAVQVVAVPRPPVVVRTDPPPRKTDVPLNAIMVIVFSAPIDSTTLTTASVQVWRGSTPVPGTVRFADVEHLRAEFHPDSLLAPQTDYELVVTQGIQDVNGEALASPVEVPFTTGTPAPLPGLIAFGSGCSWVDDSPCILEVMGVDGSGRRGVVFAASFPAWSPDGARLAYYNRLTGGIEYVEFSDSQQTRFVVTDNFSTPGVRDEAPAWSPDGKKIAFVRWGETGLRIWLVNADGSNARQLDARSGGSEHGPAWSPDGKKLALSSCCSSDGGVVILVMNADGSGPIDTLTSGSEPDWSPDGSQLAFDDSFGGTSAIGLINSDGAGRRFLTQGVGAAHSPSWSPDGTQIVFKSSIDGHEVELYVINRDGTGLQRLTSTGEAKWDPDWAGSTDRSGVRRH